NEDVPNRRSLHGHAGVAGERPIVIGESPFRPSVRDVAPDREFVPVPDRPAVTARWGQRDQA
ncbi:MAG TPA: hypothetical protein VLJ13_05235, partial [Brevundimonas sp.]|nr:hypothetical protein [Brevundimonas sp.]